MEALFALCVKLLLKAALDWAACTCACRVAERLLCWQVYAAYQPVAQEFKFSPGLLREVFMDVDFAPLVKAILAEAVHEAAQLERADHTVAIIRFAFSAALVVNNCTLLLTILNAVRAIYNE